MPHRSFVFLVVAIILLVDTSALAVSCGTDTPDERFHAVCGLQKRDMEVDENWAPEGSGTLVSWTDAQNIQHLGIVTVRHFLDQNKSIPSGNCVVQEDLWYAYFPTCPSSGPSSPCYPFCVGPNEDMYRVRIACFTLATGVFSNLPPDEEGYADSVVVGLIEPEDEGLLCNVTPMKVMSPIEAGVCRGRTCYIAGWGTPARARRED